MLGMVTTAATKSAEFEQYGPDHIGALLFLAVITTVLCVLLRRSRGRAPEYATRLAICWSLGLLLPAVAVLEQIYEVTRGWWSLEESLPLHLCDLAVVVTSAALLVARAARQGDPHCVPPDADSFAAATDEPRRPFREHRLDARQCLFELSYFWAIGGTLQAILTPDLAFRFPHPAYFTFFANHGGILAAVLVMTVGLGLRPRRGFVVRAGVVTGLVALPVGLVNWLIGANYMYLCDKPKHASIYDYFGPWPWSLITLAAVCGATLVILYSPFWFLNRRAGARRADRP